MKSIYNEWVLLQILKALWVILELEKNGLNENEFGVFLNVVKETLPVKVEIPQQIQKVINTKKVATKAANYKDSKGFLIHPSSFQYQKKELFRTVSD